MYFIFGNFFLVCYMLYVVMSVCLSFLQFFVVFFVVFYGPYVAWNKPDLILIKECPVLAHEW